MKREIPSGQESSTRMLVQSRTGGRIRDAAQTGAPAPASTTLAPTARRSVLLPDMFEPVMKRNVPGGPTSTSLRTHVPGRRRG